MYRDVQTSDHMKQNYIKTLYKQKSPSEESAPETFIGMKDDKRDHQDSKF